MARPKKTGIEYFPLDVDFFEDDKIALIEGEFGVKGSYVALRLLCKIYKNGYCYQWGEDECLLLARQLGAGFVPNAVDEIVKGLVRRSFFDKGVYDSFRVLTSSGIQKRYMEARRGTATIDPKYCLLGVSATKTPVSATKTPPKEKKREENKKENDYVVKERPPSSPSEFCDVAKLYAELKGEVACETTTADNIMRQYGMSRERVMQYLDTFQRKITLDGETHKTRRDYRSHFNNWLRIQVANGQPPDQSKTLTVQQPRQQSDAERRLHNVGNFTNTELIADF